MSFNRRSIIQGATALGLASFLPGCDTSFVDEGAVKRLRLQSSWINDAEFLGYFAALEGEPNLYESRGIDLEYIPGGPQVTPEASLLNGSADIALTTPETTAQHIVRDNVPLVIIGAQYQKNPIGIVSTKDNPIGNVSELTGKRLAVAPVNRLTVEAVLRMNGIETSEVELIPYTYDPNIILNGTADATIDFVTNVPHTIRRLGKEPVSFLLFDAGLKIYNDTVVVRRETLDDRFDDLAAFMAASIQGWQAVYEGNAFEAYCERFMTTWFKDTGRTLENEIDFAKAQRPLMQSDGGFFSMSSQGIDENIESLKVLDLGLSRDVFDTRVIERANQLIQTKISETN